MALLPVIGFGASPFSVSPVRLPASFFVLTYARVKDLFNSSSIDELKDNALSNGLAVLGSVEREATVSYESDNGQVSDVSRLMELGPSSYLLGHRLSISCVINVFNRRNVMFLPAVTSRNIDIFFHEMMGIVGNYNVGLAKREEHLNSKIPIAGIIYAYPFAGNTLFEYVLLMNAKSDGAITHGIGGSSTSIDITIYSTGLGVISTRTYKVDQKDKGGGDLIHHTIEGGLLANYNLEENDGNTDGRIVFGPTYKVMDVFSGRQEADDAPSPVSTLNILAIKGTRVWPDGPEVFPTTAFGPVAPY